MGVSEQTAMLPHRRRLVDFSRLLKATERIHKASLGLSPGQRAYQLELNRLNAFLRALREQLAELHNLDLGVVVAPKTLQEFSFRVDGLERCLMDRQQELRRFHASGALNGSKDNPSMSTKHSAVTGPDITSETVQGTRTTPCCERQEGNFLSGQAGKSKKGKGRGDRVDGGDENKVAKEKEAQQVLTEQLEELVGALKASSMLVHTSLRAQNKVLDKTEDAAQRNLDSLQVELKKTEEQLKRSWSNSLTSCFMIAIILSIFMGTLLFMRFFPKRRWILW